MEGGRRERGSGKINFSERNNWITIEVLCH